MSYSRLMRTGRDSNPRPPPWQGGILTNWTTYPFCVPSRIRTLDHFVNSEVLYRWAKETLTYIQRYHPTRIGEIKITKQDNSRVVKLQNGCISFFICREDRARTCDSLVPNQVRYLLRYFPNSQTKVIKKPRIFKIQGFNIWLHFLIIQHQYLNLSKRYPHHH